MRILLSLQRLHLLILLIAGQDLRIGELDIPDIIDLFFLVKSFKLYLEDVFIEFSKRILLT